MGKKDYIVNKHIARKLITKLVYHYASVYNVSIGRIAIRNQKTRWGSCSRLGNLNFNYRLLYLPDDLRDFVIVHELCHLLEFNHSAEFWAHVARVVPDFKAIRKRLKSCQLK